MKSHQLFLIPLLVIFILTISLQQAYAGRGHFKVGDESGFLTVHVGSSDPTMEELIERLISLERAVAHLQHECLEIVHTPPIVVHPDPIWTCEVDGFGSEVFYGNGPSKGIAKRSAMEQCQQKRNAVFCDFQKCYRE